MTKDYEPNVSYYTGCLWSLGYRGKLESMVREFQIMHGLEVSGRVDAEVVAELNNPLRCGMPDLLGNDECKWSTPNVTYHSSFQLPGYDEERINTLFDEGCALWNGHSKLHLQRVGPERPMILALAGRGRRDDFDGPGGTLAWSYMPCGRTNQVLQRYDTEERWNDNMLRTVIAHEIGHAWGAPHLQSGNLMAPTYDRRIATPQRGDIEALIARYGLPDDPTPEPNPSPGTPNKTLPAGFNLVLTTANGRRLIVEGTVRSE